MYFDLELNVSIEVYHERSDVSIFYDVNCNKLSIRVVLSRHKTALRGPVRNKSENVEIGLSPVMLILNFRHSVIRPTFLVKNIFIESGEKFHFLYVIVIFPTFFNIVIKAGFKKRVI